MAIEHSPSMAWRLNAQRYALKGTKCDMCQKPSFPPRKVCPDCREQINKPADIEKIVYSSKTTSLSS